MNLRLVAACDDFLVPASRGTHTPIMIAQGAERIDDVSDDEMLDVDTSAAILRWMETALVPDGIRPDDWERWVDSGCKASLHRDGVPVTPVMLGEWARSGTLR